jgi:lipoprotein NlpD
MPLNKLYFLILFLLLTACTSKTVYAPVVEGWKQTAGQKGGYAVQKGDSVYSIAWDYGMDYRDIVKANHLHSPYMIQVGQKLKMVSSHSNTANSIKIPKSKTVKSASTKNSAPHSPATLTSNTPTTGNTANSGNWIWPTQGKLIRNYSAGSNGNRGIDIAGKFAQPVLATSSGKVVYSGGGLRGYGQLIIIKHNDSYLSAYAFNKTLLVKEGMTVKSGQKIAEMGKDDSGHTLLHFEIRRDGKPVNPMLYLPRAKT